MMLDDGEECDDGDQVDGDGCDADCTFTRTTFVSAGGEHSCALLDTGIVRCWGSAAQGQLGHGDATDIGDDELPSSAGPVELDAAAIQLRSGYRHGCALLDDGAVRCWGDASFGQLGSGAVDNIGDDELPTAIGPVDLGGTATQIFGGFFHNCALLGTGDAICWGANPDGQLGYGNVDNVGDDELPSAVGPVATGGTVVQLATGLHHTCALLDTAEVRCWGSSAEGQLGYGTTESFGDDEPASAAGIVDTGGAVVQLAAGGFHTCALLDGGAVRCWGRGLQGQLGYGDIATIGDDEVPSAVGPVELDGVAVALAAGSFHTCALLDSGDVRCWGFGGFGELGTGDTLDIGDDELPTAVPPVDVGGVVDQLSTSNDHVCALLGDDAVRCWGLGASGRLGYGDVDDIGDDEPPSAAGDVQVF
jgi:cysteine-rich repeat protein